MAGESLRVTAGKAAGAEIALEDEFLIGRTGTDEGRLGDDPELSRRHARISRRAGDQLVIEDLGSTNGTFLNGRQLTDVQALNPGDTIKVGTTQLQVLDASGNAPQATALGAVPPSPKEQITAAGAGAAAGQTPAQPRPAAPPPPPAAPPPAAPPPGAPQAGAPQAPRRAPGAPPPPPPPAGTARSRKGPPVPLVAALGLLVVVGVVLFVVLSGGDDEADEPTVLSSGEIATANNRATVSINTTGPGFDEDFNKIVAAGGGSGIVIDQRRGYVLTNAHVVAGATSVKARLENGEDVNARVLGTAPCEDVAVIELATKPPRLKAATLGRSAPVKAGDEVTALGFPGAFEEDITDRGLKLNSGKISSSPGPATLGDSLPKLPAVIQHQAPINAGNSGGPLFNDRGEVIGVNTFAAIGESSQNQSGAIAIDRVRNLLPDLRRGEDQGYVGWNIENVPELNNDLYVLGVDANSPADKARLLFLDRIDELDGTVVENVPDVCDILGSKAAGDRMKVTGQEADGSPFTITVRLR